MGTKFSFWKMTKLLEMDGSNSCPTNMNVFKPLNCTLENGQIVKFMLCVEYHNFRERQNYASWASIGA